jgi:hypothetical protein
MRFGAGQSAMRQLFLQSRGLDRVVFFSIASAAMIGRELLLCYCWRSSVLSRMRLLQIMC